MNKWLVVVILALLVLTSAMGLKAITTHWMSAQGGGPVPPTPWMSAQGGGPVPPTPWMPAQGGGPVPPTPWK